MKGNLINSVLFTFLLMAGACTNHTADNHATYTCSMHPAVVADAPGRCPVCGMDLVPMARRAEEAQIPKELAQLLKSGSNGIIASIKTIKPQFKSVVITTDATGTVTYDARRIHTISARVAGRIEKSHLKYEYQEVKKGQKVADIYSPELLTAGRELLYLLQRDPDNGALIDAAMKKLRLLGMSDSQIKTLQQQHALPKTFSVYSPYDGFVISAPSTSTQAGQRDNDMDPTLKKGFVREGDYVDTGETLFRVVDTNALRISLDVPASWSATILEGDSVDLTFDHGATETATIDLVQPYFEPDRNFLKVRVVTNNTAHLHVGQLVTATLSMRSRESLWLPREAVIDLGNSKTVFVSDGAVLRPKKVVTGAVSKNEIEIRGGLVTSDEVAANAQFLTGSETIIKP